VYPPCGLVLRWPGGFLYEDPSHEHPSVAELRGGARDKAEPKAAREKAPPRTKAAESKAKAKAGSKSKPKAASKATSKAKAAAEEPKHGKGKGKGRGRGRRGPSSRGRAVETGTGYTSAYRQICQLPVPWHDPVFFSEKCFDDIIQSG